MMICWCSYFCFDNKLCIKYTYFYPHYNLAFIKTRWKTFIRCFRAFFFSYFFSFFYSHSVSAHIFLLIFVCYLVVQSLKKGKLIVIFHFSCSSCAVSLLQFLFLSSFPTFSPLSPLLFLDFCFLDTQM